MSRGFFGTRHCLSSAMPREIRSLKLNDRVNWLTSLQTICDDTKLNFTHPCVCVCVVVCTLAYWTAPHPNPQPSALADSHHCVNVK